MTYKIEQFVAKITSPITVKIADEKMVFGSGAELAGYGFDKKYAVAEDSAIVITLTESSNSAPPNFTGEAAQR